MTTYFALSIGPIFKTLAMARETRELWAASYIFSHLMGKLTNSYRDNGEIILPVNGVSSIHEAIKIKPGLYPDRLIVKLSSPKDFDPKIDDAKDTFFDSLYPENIPAKNFFEQYFHIHSLIIELPDNENPVQTINDILDSCELSPAYVAEFETNYVEKFLNEIKRWPKFEDLYGDGFRFPSVIEIASNDLKYAEPVKTVSALEKWIFDKNDGLKEIMDAKLLNRIKTIKKKKQTVFNWSFDFALEGQKAIQEAEIKKTIDPSNKPKRVDIIKLLKSAYNAEGCKKEEEIFRYYHKYMAVVQADGDNLSKAIEAAYFTGKIKAVQHISGLLMKFGHEVSKVVSSYGGIPVYMGGDDLLFFAPVRNKDKSLFHIIDEIDKWFEEIILKDKEVVSLINTWNASITKENRKKKVSLSMSYGISMAYHKYPLWESLETARTNLFDIAKSFPGKDAISFKVLKHGGQHYEALFAKNWKSYEHYFLGLIDKAIRQENWQASEKKITFLTSLQHNLDPLRPLLYRLLVGREIDPAKATFLEAFVNYIPDEFDREFKTNRLRENFFNEKVHKKEGTLEFFKIAFEYLLQLYRDMEDVYGNSNKTAEKAVDALYATLRLVQFFIQPDHNEINESL